MRALLWVLLLGSVGGGLLLLFSDDSGQGGADPLTAQGDGDHDLGQTGDSGLLQVDVKDVILLEGEEEWPRHLMRDGAAFVDPRALDEIEIVGPTGKDYSMTGAELLVVIEREFRGTGYQFRFKDEAAREGFKKCNLKGPIPDHAPLRLLFDQAMFAGYRFVTYAGNIYVTPAKEGQIPGAGEVPAVPVEGFAPEAPGDG